MGDQLHLYEELMLLALNDEKGTLHGQRADVAVAAAAVTELLLLDRIELTPPKRLIHVLDTTSTGDRVLDMVLGRIVASSRRAQLRNWIPRLAREKDLRHMVVQQLVDDGILTVEEHSFLGIFDRTVYPELNHGPEAAINQRIHEAIFVSTDEVAERTALLIGLADATQLLDQNFARADLRKQKKRIEQIAAGGSVGIATRPAFEAVQSVAGALAGD